MNDLEHEGFLATPPFTIRSDNEKCQFLLINAPSYRYISIQL